MYLKHYNLKEKPFNISPDARFLWMSDKHKEGLATLKYGVMENKGFLVLTGDIGTGKTLLINALIRITEVNALIATIPDPDLDIIDFFNLLAEEFQMNKTFHSKGEFLVQFKQFLLESYASDKSVLVIIDEAQRLNSEMLEQIRLLSNIELDNRKLINIFFVGQREFNQLLVDDRNKAVRQRISVYYQLEPLSKSEIADYIHHRVKKAGASEEIFGSDAVREIFKFSHGTPRLINVICDLALLTGFSAGVKKINAGVIKDCAKELQIPTDLARSSPTPPSFRDNSPPLNLAAIQQKEQSSVRGGLLFIGLIFFIFVAYQIYESVSEQPLRWNQEEIAPQKKILPSEEFSKALKTEKKEETVATGNPAEKVFSVEKEEPQITPEETVINAENSDAPSRANNQVPGSPVDTVVDQKNIIYFDHNSNELPQKAYETLDQIVKFTARRPDLRITVEGFTDSYGDTVYNRQLSQYRADMVKNYLIGHGIAPSKISAIGRGAENPLKSNRTFDGRKQNRRVEIKVGVE